jgi:hypothetical protein
MMTPRANLLDLTVTIPVVDLYDLLTREEIPMPTAPNQTKTKRGYRRLSFVVKLAEYDLLSQIAEAESRTPDQQALWFLRRAFSEVQTEAIRGAYREALNRRISDAEEENGVAIDPEEPVEVQ